MTDRERLDEVTETLIEDVHCRRPRALAALRTRIRELVNEAQNTGEPPKAWSPR